MSAILFDMDGTLIDSEPIWLEAEIEVMAEVGCKWDQADQINCLGGPMDRTEKYMQERSNNIKPYGYFGKRLEAVMEIKLSEKLELLPNALNLLKQCQNLSIPMALVTASTGKLMRSALTKFPKDIFAVTISCDDVVKTKPDPAPYLLAAEKLSVDITQCVVFEDSLTGIKSALGSGAQVVGIPHLVTMPSDPNLRVIDSLTQIDIQQVIAWYPFLNSRVAAK